MVKEPWKDISSINDLFHAPVRIAIMVFLLSVGQAKFTVIQNAVGISSGNLSSHLKKLSKADYVAIEKKFVDDKPITIVYINSTGVQAIKNYVELLNNALK